MMLKSYVLNTAVLYRLEKSVHLFDKEGMPNWFFFSILGEKLNLEYDRIGSRGLVNLQRCKSTVIMEI